jgi:hypothetical protein
MSVIPYPATVVGLPVTPVHATLLAVAALTPVILAPFQANAVAVTVPAVEMLPPTVALPESQRLLHLLAVAPISLDDEVISGNRLPEIVRFWTVRLTRVSVMTLPCTVRSQVMRVAQETVRRDDGEEVPIPTLPVESIRIASVTPAPTMNRVNP